MIKSGSYVAAIILMLKTNEIREGEQSSIYEPCRFVSINKYKNISIKMLKDVVMTVLRSRETNAVYIQQHRE